MAELIKLKCKECGTAFFGVEGRDTYCHICKTIITFREAFNLTDISVEEIDFNRIRDPRWMECGKSKEDWRNYIPEGLRLMWMEIPFEARALAVMFAEREARAVDIISDKVAGMIKKEEP